MGVEEISEAGGLLMLSTLRQLLGIDATPVVLTCPRCAAGRGPLCDSCTEQIAARLPAVPVVMLGTRDWKRRWV